MLACKYLNANINILPAVDGMRAGPRLIWIHDGTSKWRIVIPSIAFTHLACPLALPYWPATHCACFFVGVYCRDGNNATIDQSVCLMSKLMDQYRQMETHRECRIPCRRDDSDKSRMEGGCHQHATMPEARSLCPRNCIGTRIISGMSAVHFTI